MMAELNLDAIETRASAATPGPWEHVSGPAGAIPGRFYMLSHEHSTIYMKRRPFGGDHADKVEAAVLPQSSADAAFIAAARADVPALIAELRRLRAARDRALEAESHMALACPGCHCFYGCDCAEIEVAMAGKP